MQTIIQPTPLLGENIQDVVASLLVAGANVTLTYNDVANTLTIAATGGTVYTNEEAQDAVGTILVDTPTIDLTYVDATPSISAAVINGSIGTIQLTDDSVTYAKLQNVTDNRLLGRSAGSAGDPQEITIGTGLSLSAGILTSTADVWEREAEIAGTLSSGLLAFWRMEETTGNRLDSVSGMALVPTGTTTYGVGMHGNAAKITPTFGAYFSIADNATLSVGATQDFTVACWVCWDSTVANNVGIVGKGNAATNNNGAEYILLTSSGTLQFCVGNNTTNTMVNSGYTPVTGTWFLAIAWLDAAANLLYIQVNNNTPVSTACTHDSYDSTFAMQIGHLPNNGSSNSLQGRIDNVMFYKRVLNSSERTLLWNGGLGLDYADLAATIPAFVHPTTITDLVLAGGDTLTATEPLESTRGIKLGNTTGTINGIIRWTGTDLEVRKNNAWVSLTASDGVSETFLHMGA